MLVAAKAFQCKKEDDKEEGKEKCMKEVHIHKQDKETRDGWNHRHRGREKNNRGKKHHPEHV